MVGSTPEKLESSVGESLTEHSDPLKEDISQYLLLHHNYAAKPETEPNTARRPLSRRKLKEIRPKSKPAAVPAVQTPIVTVEECPEQEVLYGTYDEATNCLTIIVNEEKPHLTVPDSNKDPSSPFSSSSSDCGYESYDSPHSAGEVDAEMWDESISQLSELFPSLL